MPMTTPIEASVEARELLACPNPWCCSTTRPLPVSLKREGWRVSCACGVHTYRAATEAEAITAWNTRSTKIAPNSGEVAIPAGMVVVPREPTEAMLEAYYRAANSITANAGTGRNRGTFIWSAMLGAYTPKAPAPIEGGGEVTLLEAARDLIEARERLGPAMLERNDLWRCLSAIVETATLTKPTTDVLREALEPFAAVVTDLETHGSWLDLDDDHHIVGRIRRRRDEGKDPPTLTLGHLRLARTALREGGPSRG